MLNRIKVFSYISILFAVVLTSCTSEQPTPVIVEVTRPVLQTVVVTQLVEVEVVITATPEPATATPFPTPTLPFLITPLSETSAVLPNQPSLVSALPSDVSFWCLPASDGVIPVDYSPVPPNNAILAHLTNGQVEYIGTFSQCTFVYDFKSPVPLGALLEVKDNSNSIPFLTVKMNPDPTNPNKGYAVVKHSMVIAPPAWEIYYEFTVTSSSSSSVWTSPVHYDRGWRAPVCWTGLSPNPVTLACPAWQDTHPSDPGYTPPAPEK
jgi:hypothetical protein